MTHLMETIPQKYKEWIQEAQAIQFEWDKIFHEFMDKVSVYSWGILSVSLTAFLALKDKTSFTYFEKNIFFTFILCFIIALISSIFVKYFSAYQKFSQKSVRLALLEINLQSIQLESLSTSKLVTKEWENISSEDIQSNINRANKTLEKLNQSEDYFWQITTLLIRISISAFIIWIIMMTFLAFWITYK